MVVLNKVNALSFFFSIVILGQLQSFSEIEFRTCAYKTFGEQNASQLLQQYGKEAQELVGIPKSNFIPIKVISSSVSPNLCDNVYALNCSGAVFVRNDLEKQSNNNPGLIRLTLAHEMVHRKQFNPRIGTFKLLHPDKYTTIEEEADSEAVNRGNCWRCTLEFANFAYSEHDVRQAAQKNRACGYLSREKLLEIAAKQKNCGALCRHHRTACPHAN